jgi:hypothetical protein
MAATKGPKIPYPSGCIPRYLAMATWKVKQTAKKNRGSRTASKMARIYVAYPPEEGWPGGADCSKNGLKARSK